MSLQAALGVDIGGTGIAVGAVDPDGRVVAEADCPTRADGPGGALVTILGLAASVRADAEARGYALAGAGVGVPGIVDAAAGVVGPEVPHVPELAGRPLAAELADALGLPVSIDNDVNALAVGEWRFGVARGARSLVVLAPGTGFGAGIILEGRLVRGALGFGGELGHAPVDFGGRPCWCGGRGCLAVYASGRGIAEAGRALAGTPTGAALLASAGGDPRAIASRLVFELAAGGDPGPAGIVDEACRALGAMVAVVVNGLNPEVVVITGGVASSYLPLAPRVRAAAAAHAYRRALEATRLEIVPLDKRVAMRGAAALVLAAP